MIPLSVLKKKEGFNVFTLILSIIVSYMLVHGFQLEKSVQGFMLLVIILTAIWQSYHLIQKDNTQQLIPYIIWLGCVMRIGYMLYTPCTVRVHDIGEIAITSDGNAAYILQILKGHLPYSNAGQFYHPPLYYLLSGLVIVILGPLLQLSNEVDMIDCAKLISCIFSCLTLYSMDALCSELKINKVIPLSLVSFLPNFYLMGGRVNNDAMATFFMIMICLYSVRWRQKQSTQNTVILALCFGLGMMSKMSVALFALPTGLLMSLVLIKKMCRHDNWQKVLKSLCLFGVISFPLGLAYPIRNRILFDQPFNYVLDAGNGSFAAWQYTPVQRFLSFPINKLINPVYNHVHTDYNVWLYLLKGGLFGEFQFSVPTALPAALLLIYSLLSLLMVLAVFYSLSDRDKDIAYLLSVLAVMMASYILFNIKYPYGCTMDFRYIAPVFMISALLLGRMLEKHKSEKAGSILYRAAIGMVLSFSILSVYMFCII